MTTIFTEILKKSGMSQAELAKAVGKSPQAVSTWMRGVMPRDEETLAKIATALGVSPARLRYGDEATQEQSYECQDGFVLIPHLDIAASCGKGTEGQMNPPLVKLVKVSMEWLRIHAPYAQKNALNIIVADGDSMNPTINNGDMVVIDVSVKGIVSDAIYCFVKGSELFVKRIQRIANGIRVISDNHLYPPFEITGTDVDSIRIVGKVCSIGNFRDI